MCALSRSTLGDEGIAVAVLSHQRRMDEQRVVPTASEGEDEHQRIVEPEATHVVVAVKGTAAASELLVGTQQTALGTIDILDDVLIASIIDQVDNGLAVSPLISVSIAFVAFPKSPMLPD